MARPGSRTVDDDFRGNQVSSAPHPDHPAALDRDLARRGALDHAHPAGAHGSEEAPDAGAAVHASLAGVEPGSLDAGRQGRLELAEIRSLDEARAGSTGILEPVRGQGLDDAIEAEVDAVSRFG